MSERECLSERPPAPLDCARLPLPSLIFLLLKENQSFSQSGARPARPSVGHGGQFTPAHLSSLPPAFCSFSSRLKMSTEQNLNFLLLRPQNEEPPSNCRRRLRSLCRSLPLCFVGSIVRVSPLPSSSPFGARTKEGGGGGGLPYCSLDLHLLGRVRVSRVAAIRPSRVPFYSTCIQYLHN